MGKPMTTGTRLPDLVDGDHFPILNPGEYRKAFGVWYCCSPTGLACGLGKHDVAEHADGTITVSPSILVTRHSGESWHGYLERGVWREV